MAEELRRNRFKRRRIRKNCVRRRRQIRRKILRSSKETMWVLRKMRWSRPSQSRLRSPMVRVFSLSLTLTLTLWAQSLSFLCLCVSVRSKVYDYRKLELESLFFFLEGTSPIGIVDKPRSSFSSWSVYQKRNPATTFEASTPWSKLLSQSAQVWIFVLGGWVELGIGFHVSVW